MNKKLFLGMFAAAGMLLATSCSNDELDVVQSGNEAQVTFSLAAEGGIETRAISDGTGADKLVYAVYKLNAQEEPELQKVVGSDEKGQFVKTDFKSGDNVSITLAKGQTYQVAFWAQNKSCTAYTTTDLRNVVVNYAGNNNDETRDAFFKMVEFEVAGDKSIDVVMKRPFAQINVGVTAEDWNAAVASGIEIKKSDVVIKNAATSINLLTGKISGEQDVTYTINAIPGEKLMVDADSNGTKEAYHWLSMSYILVNDTHTTDEDSDGTIGDNRTNLESLAYTFTPEIGNAIAFAEGLNNVPVQRNWRTNILGKILTGDIQFNITIDPVYDGDIIFPDASGSAQELEFAATFGGTVTLKEDVTLTEPLTVGADMVLNIEEGKSLTGSLNLLNGAHLTVNGGAINNTDENTSGIVSYGNLTLNDVEITSARHALQIRSGNVVIYGGTYKIAPASSKTLYALNVGDAGTVANVIIKGGTFIGPKGTIADSGSAVGVKVGSSVTIEGGNFSGGKNNTLYSKGTLNVVGGTFDQNPSNWVATGYKVLPSGSNFVVVSNDIDAVASSAAELSNAIANGNANIVLAPGTYIIPDDAKGKTLTFIGTGNPEDTKIATQDDGSYEGVDYSLDGATVTFENITINTDSHTYTGYARCNGTYKNCVINGTYTLYGDSKFENCTFNVSGDVYNIWTWGAPNATFDGCTFNSDGKAMLLYGTENTNLIIKNSVFNDKGGLTDLKAAIEIGNDYSKSYTLVVNNTVVNGYEINDKGINTGTTLWANKNSMGTDNLSVTVDGVKVY